MRWFDQAYLEKFEVVAAHFEKVYVQSSKFEVGILNRSQIENVSRFAEGIGKFTFFDKGM